MDRAADIAVILVEPLYEENIGYVARVMKNFGFKRLVLVKPRCSLGLEAIKRSMHARDVLESALLVDDLQRAINGYDLVVGTTGKHGKRPSQTRRCMTPERLAEKVASFKGSVALVFGREDTGLTNEELRMCDAIVTIPANPEYPILNLSHAVAVILYEIFKRVEKGHLPELSMPDRREVDVLLDYVRKLASVLWSTEGRVERCVLTMRRFIASCMTTREDVRVLLGLIRGAYDLVSRTSSSSG